jgi:HAE1 family hydrophobic/amphiphilic exporter-1
MDGTQEIGLAVLATTLSIVAVFLPIGFMGGIIGKFFHEFGITIVAAVLISMFVSFTLDPMLSASGTTQHRSPWQAPGPAGHAVRQDHRPRHRLFDRSPTAGRRLPRILAGRWAQAGDGADRAGHLSCASVFMVPLLGTEFVPKADFSETTVNFYTPVGSSLEVTEPRRARSSHRCASSPRCATPLTTINTGNARQGKIYASIYVRWSTARSASAAWTSLGAAARAAGAGAGHHRHPCRPARSGGRQKQIEFSLQGPDQAELERLTWKLMDKIRGARPGGPGLQHQARQAHHGGRCAREAASDLGLGVAQIAGPLRTLVAGQTVGNWRAADDQTYDVNVRLSPEARDTLADLERLPLHHRRNADGSPRIVRLNQVARRARSPPAQPDQPPRPDAREWPSTPTCFIRSTGEVSADIRRAGDHRLPAGLPLPVRRLDQEHGRNPSATPLSALVLAIVFIYMILASQFKSFLAAAGADDLAAADADRRGAGAADVRLHAVDVLHHRRRDADGPGDQERHPAGGLRHPRPRSTAWSTARPGPADGWRACGCARS